MAPPLLWAALLLLLHFFSTVYTFTFPDRDIFPCVVLPLTTPTIKVIPDPTSPWFNSNLTAVILESRDSPMLISAITSALANFPARTRIQVFHSPGNARVIYKSFLPLITSGKVVPVMLSCSRFEVDSVTTSVHFWRAVIGEQVVIFQLDGTLCGGGREYLEGYLSMGYDYIGAPWAPRSFVPHTRTPVGNGGFSLRTKSTHLAIVQAYDYGEWYSRGLRDSHITGWSLHEDLYFSHYLPLVGGRVAPAHIAQGFSVETVYHPHPVGAHAFWKHPGSLTAPQVAHLLHHCPELIPHWTADTSPTFSFDLMGLDTVVASARAGYGVGAMPAGERGVAWRRDVWGGVVVGRGGSTPLTFKSAAGESLEVAAAAGAATSSTHLHHPHPLLPTSPHSRRTLKAWECTLGSDATWMGGGVDDSAPPPVRASRGQKVGAGGAGTAIGSMTMGWRVGSPVLTLGSWGGGGGGELETEAEREKKVKEGEGGDKGSVSVDLFSPSTTSTSSSSSFSSLTSTPPHSEGGDLTIPPSQYHWHSTLLALPNSHPNTSTLTLSPFTIPALLLTLGPSLNALDWKMSAAAWSSVPGLRWSRLPCLPSERRQKYGIPVVGGDARDAQDSIIPPPTRLSPPLTPSLAHQAHLSNPTHFPPLPWWISPSLPTWPVDVGASEDTALRQIGGVVGADGGTATIALVVGHSARPGGGGGESVGKALAALVAQKGGDGGGGGGGPTYTPLTARKDWDVIVLSPLVDPLPGGTQPPHPSSPSPSSSSSSSSSSPARAYYVYRPPGFVGVLEVYFERPTPPLSPNMGENVHPTTEDLMARWRGGNRSEGESHFATWQPCTLCPTPISTAGPYPAYLVRPSFALLSNLNAMRKLSTVNAHTLPHPSASNGGDPPSSSSSSSSSFFYKDSVEPYGVLPWLCVWPGVRVLMAEHPMVSSDGGMQGRRREGGGWGGEEEEVEMEVGSGEDVLEGEAEVGRSTGWDLPLGGGLAAQLGDLLDSLPPPTLPRAVRALKCTQSLSPTLCVPEPNYFIEPVSSQ